MYRTSGTTIGWQGQQGFENVGILNGDKNPIKCTFNLFYTIVNTLLLPKKIVNKNIFFSVRPVG